MSISRAGFGLPEESSPIHTSSEFPSHVGPSSAGVVVLRRLCLWICVWFCNSSETRESLRAANPTCYPRVIVFGLVVMTERADVTKTLALVLQTNVKHGQPYYLSRPSFPLNGWSCFFSVWVEAFSRCQVRVNFHICNQIHFGEAELSFYL